MDNDNDNPAGAYKELEGMGSLLPEAFCGMAIKRLETLGFGEWDKDGLWNLAFCIRTEEAELLDYCHIDSVPPRLYPVLCNRSCGRFLYERKQTGNLEIGALDLGGVLTSLSEGDVKVGFDKGASDEERLNALLQEMMGSGRRQLACYRKIRF